MLDNIFKLFDVTLPNKEVKNSALVIAGCNAYIRDMKDDDPIIYSEFEELSFSYLNNNDYGAYGMEIEFCFENNLSEMYHCFYAGCFSIRADSGLIIKLNGSPTNKCLSKINKNNQMAVGIGMYFRSIEEYQMMLEGAIILIEGFIALDNYNNTFGVSCKLEKHDTIWKIVFANTYQMEKRTILEIKCIKLRGKKYLSAL